VFRRYKPSIFALLATLLLGVAIGFSFIGAAHPVLGQAAVPTDAQTEMLRAVYAKANPSVVSIDVRVPASGDVQTFPNGRNQQQPFQFAAGSGFVYDTAGHIVTNAHVVENADRIEIVFSDGTRMRATVVGQDPDADIAVIKASGDISKYAPLVMANSDQVQVGDRAIAIGNPFERAGTMTHGIISGIHRSVQGLNGNFTIR
jgi:serine protease DegQ